MNKIDTEEPIIIPEPRTRINNPYKKPVNLKREITKVLENIEGVNLIITADGWTLNKRALYLKGAYCCVACFKVYPIERHGCPNCGELTIITSEHKKKANRWRPDS